jgi:hypothetical protein
VATFYVRTDGSDSNTGTGPGTGQAWATVGKALSATGISSGDTVYVAPGIYASQINVLMTSATAPTYIIGDPKALQFSGVTAAPVILTNYNSALTGSGYSNHVVSGTSKNFLNWSNISFKFNPPYGINVSTSRKWSFTNCSFSQRNAGGTLFTITTPVSTALDLTIDSCIFHGGTNLLSLTGAGISDGSTIKNSIFRSNIGSGIILNTCQATIFNCLFITSIGIDNRPAGSIAFPATITNSITMCWNVDLVGGTLGALIETYNRLLGNTTRSNVAIGAGTVTTGDIGFDIGESLLFGLPAIEPFTSFLNSPNANFGTLTGAPTTDLYGNAWTGPNPDAGAGTYKTISGGGLLTHPGMTGGIRG